MFVNEKFNKIIDRLCQKIRLSQTPVPGFILGLSGTDSILTFILMCESAKHFDMINRVYGIHYVNEQRRKKTWFEEQIIPWLKEKYPEARLEVQTPLGGNYDQQRWADLHLRSLNEIIVNGSGDKKIAALAQGENYWVVGCINATEKILGKYSILSKSVSMEPIQSLYKSEVLEICKEYGVPEIALEMSQLPDCLCGREEIAAQNLKLIDDIITFKLDMEKYPKELINEVYQYINETKASNNFKNRTPFSI